jgi:hypothetical protein
MANDSTKTTDETRPEPSPPAAAPTPSPPPIDPNMPIQLVLTVEQVNICLAGIAKLPLEQGLNTFQILKGQGDMAIAVSQGTAGQMANSNGTQPGRLGKNSRRKH